MRQNLSTPCNSCPFRRDHHGFLRGARMEGIIESIEQGVSFACHKTTFDDDGDDRVAGSESSQCAGAEIFLALRDMPETQIRQISGRLGLPVAKLNMGAAVFDSADGLVRHHEACEEALA